MKKRLTICIDFDDEVTSERDLVRLIKAPAEDGTMDGMKVLDFDWGVEPVEDQQEGGA